MEYIDEQMLKQLDEMHDELLHELRKVPKWRRIKRYNINERRLDAARARVEFTKDAQLRAIYKRTVT